jgi:hypothetical protein
MLNFTSPVAAGAGSICSAGTLQHSKKFGTTLSPNLVFQDGWTAAIGQDGASSSMQVGLLRGAISPPAQTLLASTTLSAL